MSQHGEILVPFVTLKSTGPSSDSPVRSIGPESEESAYVRANAIAIVQTLSTRAVSAR